MIIAFIIIFFSLSLMLVFYQILIFLKARKKMVPIQREFNLLFTDYSTLKKECYNKSKFIGEYYIEMYFDDHEKRMLSASPNHTPLWVRAQLVRNPKTKEAKDFLQRIKNLDWNLSNRFSFKEERDNLSGNLEELKDVYNKLLVYSLKIEEDFPEVYKAVRRCDKLNELGINE